MTESYDIAVIGAGMAGASIAAELASHARVLLAEAEPLAGYHATGRSAAFWDECYGGPDVVPLTLASGPYLREHGMLSPRGALHIARARRSGSRDFRGDLLEERRAPRAARARCVRGAPSRRAVGLDPGVF